MHRIARSSATLLIVLSLALSPRAAHAVWPHDTMTNVQVAPGGNDQELNAMVEDGAGGAYFAWTDKRGGTEDVYLQHVTAAGTTAGWPASGYQVCTTASRKLEPQLVADGTGGVIVIWTDYRNSSSDIFAQHVLGNATLATGWTAAGVALTTTGYNDVRPRACGDGAGGAFATWEDLFGANDTDILAAHVTAAGAVTFSQYVTGTTADQRHPAIAPDASGGCYVAYQDSSSAGIRIWAQHLNGAGGSLAGPAKISNNYYLSTKKQPHLVPDGTGGIYAAWMDNDNDVATFDLAFLRLSATLTVMPGWFDAGSNTGGGIGPVQDFTLIPDDANGFYAAWTTAQPSGDILVRHAMPSAVFFFSQLDLSIQPEYLRVPQIARDGSNGLLLLGGNDRVTRLTATGTPANRWPYGGVDQCDWNAGFTDLRLVSDGERGAISGWTDNRAFTGFPGMAVYAQRVDRFAALGNAEPSIVSIKDAPKDQGGEVRLVWNASYLDADPTFEVGSYWIWRQTPAAAAQQAVRAGARWLAPTDTLGPAMISRGRVFRPSSLAGYAWEYLATQNSNGSAQYSYLAPTSLDSTTASNPRTAFMVEAHSSVYNAWWDSAPDSGYSVDNLPPFTPAPFLGVYSGGMTHLHWGPNLEADLAGYRLYRGASAAFVPGPSNRIASPPDTGYSDIGAAGAYYKLSAIDIHGNESPFALLAPAGTTTTGEAAPRELALAPTGANPAHGVAGLRFALTRDGVARLAVFDLQGRLVRELVDGPLAAGEHRVVWDGRDADGGASASGVYLVRLEAEGRSLLARLVLTR